MRIGFVATRLAGEDSVSLEASKWVTVLKRMGHEVFYCAGELNPHGAPGMLVSEMHPHHPALRDLQRTAFEGVESFPDLETEIEHRAQGLGVSLRAFIEDFALDLLVIENAFALPLHLPLGLALHTVIRETGIPTIAHHHDFYWERDRYLVNRVPSILRLAFPPRLPTVRHVVLSTVMQRELWVRSELEATVIPIVFDFENPPPPPDEHSRSFREEMGFGPDDVVILQPTQVAARKAIEHAIGLIQMLGTRRKYQFVVTGGTEDGAGEYFEWLLDVAVRAGIDVYFIQDRIGRQRVMASGQRIYTLSDIYPQSNLVTILSRYEGFGSTLIEALYFKRPFVVNLYPAYRADVRAVGVQAIEINGVVTAHAALEVLRLLDDPAWIERMVEDNYLIGLHHFSYRVLERKLAALLEQVVPGSSG